MAKYFDTSMSPNILTLAFVVLAGLVAGFVEVQCVNLAPEDGKQRLLNEFLDTSS